MCHEHRDTTTLRERMEGFLEWRNCTTFIPLTAKQIGAILTFVQFVELKEKEFYYGEV